MICTNFKNNSLQILTSLAHHIGIEHFDFLSAQVVLKSVWSGQVIWDRHITQVLGNQSSFTADILLGSDWLSSAQAGFLLAISQSEIGEILK